MESVLQSLVKYFSSEQAVNIISQLEEWNKYKNQNEDSYNVSFGIDSFDRKTVNHTFRFPFENDVTRISFFKLIHLWWIGFVIGPFFLLTIYYLKRFMSDRKKYRLRKIGIFWYVFMLILNFVATFKTAPTLIYILQNKGFFFSVCVSRLYLVDSVVGFWTAAFPIIKVLELGDVYLIILQKRKLESFLWYHHMVVMLYGCFLYIHYPSVAFWLAVVNNASHIPVYLYGTIRAFGIRPPKLVPLFMLLLEAAQMVFGLWITGVLTYYWLENRECSVRIPEIAATFAVYFSFFIFCIFMLTSRVKKMKKQCASVRTKVDALDESMKNKVADIIA